MIYWQAVIIVGLRRQMHIPQEKQHEIYRRSR